MKESTPSRATLNLVPKEAQPGSNYAERYAAGQALREVCPREAHADWKTPSDRRDPVELVLESEKGRLPELLPQQTKNKIIYSNNVTFNG